MSSNVDNDNVPIGVKPPIESEGWCTTRTAKDVHFKFVWTIENFSRELEKTETGIVNRKESSVFSILNPDDVQTKWKLILCLNQSHLESAGKIVLLLKNLSDHEIRCVYRYEISILDVEKKQVIIHSSPLNPIFLPSRSIGSGLSRETFQGPLAAKLLPQNKLTIVCDMTLSAEKESQVSGMKQLQDAKTQKIFNPGEQLMSDYEFALDNQDLSDVKIVCGDQVFDCHRIILSTRSSVFRAMFQHNMTEARTRRVEIKELEPSVVQAMLEFIYIGKMKFPTIRPEDMLKVSQMYDLKILKDFHEENLCQGLNVSNCVHMLLLGDLHEAVTLKRDAMKLIVLNLSSVVKTQDWQEKMIRYPVLMSEVMEKVGEMAEPPKKRARTEDSQPILID